MSESLKVAKSITMKIEAWKRLEDMSMYFTEAWQVVMERCVNGAWQLLMDDPDTSGQKFRQFLNEKVKKENAGVLMG